MVRNTGSSRRAIIAVTFLAIGLGLVSLLTTGVLPAANAATRTVYIPSDWAATGEVPWAQNRTKESANFILLWGEKSGTDPKSAPGEFRFDPDNILSQLEKLYAFYLNTVKFTPEAGVMAQHKVVVIITRTWNRTALDAWATGGSADNKVGVMNLAPGAAQPGSWALAHELGHVFENFTFLGKGGGVGLTDQSAGTFWETGAEYLAMQAYPDGGAGDLARFLRTENLAYSSSRHHYGNWMLVQYLVDKRDGITTFNRIWNEAKNNEHPLEVYRRIYNLTPAQLATDIGEYAQHQVTYDYSNRSHFMPFINNVYGRGFLLAYNGVPVEAVNQAAGHYAISDAMAPSDFGYNKIKLVPASDGALIQLHFKGHVNSAAQSGWSYGFVAVKNGTPRYGTVSTSPDGELSFQTQPGETEVYLAVAGAPTTVHHYAFLDGYTKNYRYPYEFRISGATPSGHEPGYTKPAATGGGHWHSNGGGWVSNQANVAASAYVGPRAAVFGNSTVSGNARIEGLGWVNGGATVTGNAVVKDNAIVQGGANLSGNVVFGGDAETSGACSSGTYLIFNPNRGCDGRGGETDINPPHGRFTDAELAITGGGTPNPSVSPSASRSPSASPSASPSRSASPSASPTASVKPTVSATTSSGGGLPGKTCTASYKVISQWPGSFQGEVSVTAGGSSISGWRVTWTYATGQTINQSWNADLTSSGANVTASNVVWNGALAANASAAFGFIGNYGATNAIPTPTCTAV